MINKKIYFDKSNFKISLSYLLNDYRFLTSKEKKEATLDWLILNDKESYEKVKSNNEYDFVTIGSICKMLNDNLFTLQEYKDNYGDTFNKLLYKLYKPTKVKPIKDTIEPIKKVIDNSLLYGGQLDGEIDEFVLSKCKADINITRYVTNLSIPPNTRNSLYSFYMKLENELTEVIGGQCEQLNMGYSYLTKPQLKKYLSFVHDMNTALAEKTKVVKPKPTKNPVILIKKLRYKIRDNELNIFSVKPTSIIGAKELWVYNTANSKLICYVATKDNKLSVNGMGIVNYDLDKTKQRYIANPSVLVDVSKTKKQLNEYYDSLDSRTSKGIPQRLTEDCLLLATF